jgi:hypothetical protein|tara:strand:+ start:83 stop:559 length:477 start_codon:yes stop_codon:yes gene_type:complete
MTVRNSPLVVNSLATPVVMNDASLYQGVMRIAQGTFELLAGDSTDNDVIYFAQIPSNATIVSIKVGSDTLGGSCTFNVGLHTSAGVVVDEDYFATLVADEGAMTELRYEAAAIETTGLKVYEMAGVDDPGGYYFVSATFAATGGTAGTMSFIIQYVVN